MIKKAKVFGFFPATWESETQKVELKEGAWQNGLLFDVFLAGLKFFNIFYEAATGKYVRWLVWHDE